MEGGLVDDVGEVGAGESGREGGKALGEDVGLVVEHDALHVLLEDLLALEEVRQVDLDVTVEPAGAEEGLVQYVRSKNEETSNTLQFEYLSIVLVFRHSATTSGSVSKSITDLKPVASSVQFLSYTQLACLWRPA